LMDRDAGMEWGSRVVGISRASYYTRSFLLMSNVECLVPLSFLL
jgi:hypothetical protein